jgi:hypothetical protein
MSEPITFFRRRQEAGHTYKFDLQSSTIIYGSSPRVYRVFVYSREPIEGEGVQPRKFLDYDQELIKLRQAVRPDGAIVWTYEEGATRFFQVVPVGADGSRFKSYGVLRPGAELSLEEETLEKWLKAPAGTHLLVPVDRQEEEHLKSLKEYLGSLPPDLESLILYAIRKPSLDSRLRDLEAKKAAAAGWVGQIREWSIPILLVLILALNVVLLVRTFPPRDNSTDGEEATTKTSSSTTTSTSENTPPPKNPPKPVNPPKPDPKIFEILQAVQKKAGAYPAFADLCDQSFKGLASERDVAAALTDAKKSKPLVLGLMKLEAIKLGTANGVKDLFKRGENPITTKGAFRGQKALDADKNAQELLAVLGCLGYKVPGLPEIKLENGKKSPELLFIQGQKDCKSFPPDKATPGLNDLLKSVEQYSPKGGASGGAS